MFRLRGIGDVAFEFPVVVRTVLFIHCGGVRTSLGGAMDYLEIVGRLYSSANPQQTNEKHVGKLYIRAHGSPENPRYETSIEQMEWHPDGSFEVIQPDGTRTRVIRPSE
jgi:hypothetical protein